MTDATIRVGTAVTRIYGLPGLRASDIYANAPEPAPADWNGIRSTSANLTYLDETLRLSRGDKGNIFILTMDDPSDRP